MTTENHLDNFDKKLHEKEAAKSSPPNPLWEVHTKFNKIYEKQLLEEEEKFLKSDSILPIIELVDKTAAAIEKKENFPQLRTQNYTGYAGKAGEYRLKKRQQFQVEIVGHHGDETHPEWENEGRFVQTVESGKQISNLLSGVTLLFTYTQITFGIEISKGSKSVKLFFGGSGETVDIDSNFATLFDKLTNIVVNRLYIDHRGSGIDMGEGWSLN